MKINIIFSPVLEVAPNLHILKNLMQASQIPLDLAVTTLLSHSLHSSPDRVQNESQSNSSEC